MQQEDRAGLDRPPLERDRLGLAALLGEKLPEIRDRLTRAAIENEPERAFLCVFRHEHYGATEVRIDQSGLGDQQLTLARLLQGESCLRKTHAIPPALVAESRLGTLVRFRPGLCKPTGEDELGRLPERVLTDGLYYETARAIRLLFYLPSSSRPGRRC